MSIYIPDMEMPTSCIACHLNFGEKRPEYGLTIYCPYSDGVISWRDKAFDNGRLASCGIIPVPEHGRTIDADALLNHEVETWTDHRIGRIYLQPIEFANRIMCAPTIIPADPVKEETE